MEGEVKVRSIHQRNRNFHIVVSLIFLAAAVPVCFTKELFFKILQYLQKNTCDRVFKKVSKKLNLQP